MAVEIVRYKPAHAAPLVAGLREIDRRELYYLTRLGPAAGLDFSTEGAVACWTALDDGAVVCTFGINRRSALSEVGVPWLVGTSLVDKHWRKFGRLSRDYFDRMALAFPQMENFCLAENVTTIRWLKWLGFDMDEPAPMGFSRAPFVRFSKGMKHG